MTEQKDYNDYGYKENTKIEITSELFSNINVLVQHMANKESFVAVDQKETLEDTLGAENTMKHVITPEGILALRVILALNTIHQDNVENGVAIHKDELNKPKITIA